MKEAAVPVIVNIILKRGQQLKYNYNLSPPTYRLAIRAHVSMDLNLRTPLNKTTNLTWQSPIYIKKHPRIFFSSTKKKSQLLKNISSLLLLLLLLSKIMGICSSCESTHVATVKLILQDGRLQEYSYPVKVSYVLQKHPTYFICNSDEMEFDDIVSPISDDEELQPGQLYFALPLSRLKHPLHAEEMAALAVKASSALMKSADKCACCKKSVRPFPFSSEDSPRKMSTGGGRGGSGVGGLRRGGRGRRFSAMLSAIPE